jgi:hypothetical protein
MSYFIHSCYQYPISILAKIQKKYLLKILQLLFLDGYTPYIDRQLNTRAGLFLPASSRRAFALRIKKILSQKIYGLST